MLLNQSQIYESMHQADNITEDEIDWFIEKMEKKFEGKLKNNKKMDNNQYERVYGEWVGVRAEKALEGQDVGNVIGDLREEGLDKDDGTMVEKQSARTEDVIQCKLCHYQFNSMISYVPKYTCGLCSVIFCENCLGRFQAPHSQKKPIEENEENEQEKHIQSISACQKCDNEHIKELIRVQKHRMLQLGKRVLNKIKNQNLALDLEINFQKTNTKSPTMSRTTSSATNKQSKMKNKQTQLLISNGILESEIAELHKRIQYGKKVQKQLTQKCIRLQRQLSRSVSQIDRINPPCAYESQRAQSETDILKDSNIESVLQDETRLINSRSPCFGIKCPPPCSLM